MNNCPKTVLVADSAALSRQGICLLLERAGYRIAGQASHGQQAILMADELQPDLLLTDLDLELVPGIEVIRQVRRICPKTAVMVLTQISGCAGVIGAIRAGASGYCLRTSSAEEFHRALSSVLHGDLYVCTRLAKYLVPGRCSAQESQDCNGVSCLTARELQVLKLVVEGNSSPRIAELLELSCATIDRHRANLMKKLSLHSVPELVLFAVRCGLVDLMPASA